jgi:hypothetical protein
MLLPATAARAQGHPPAQRDTAYEAMQRRGKDAMGVDQYTSVHLFDELPGGGRIELQRGMDDSAGVLTIRKHLRSIATAFSSGDFDTPAYVHMTHVPGADTMARLRGAIRYDYRDLPRGGEIRITTKDPVAVRAVHEFIAFQRHDHHAGGKELSGGPDRH